MHRPSQLGSAAAAHNVLVNTEWKWTNKICLRGVVYHSACYKRAKKSNSHQVSFYHAIPGEADPVVHFADIQYYVYGEYQEHHFVFAYVKCHTAINICAHENAHIHQRYRGLKHARLADSQASGLSIVPASSVISRVIFIRNQKLPLIAGVQPMFVSPDVDHKHEFE